MSSLKIGVVIPCYKVRKHILSVLEKIPPDINKIYIIDDACPESSGSFVKESSTDLRVSIIQHKKNTGVGGAVISGYKRALSDDCDIIVKLDGDGQMDPSDISKLIQPIVDKQVDYTKGNRFFSLESLTSMPTIRKLGNAALSFVNKVSSGYWNIMDPTNGFTAIHKSALSVLPLEKINAGYFFESDMLFRLGTIRAVVMDIPIQAKYDEEESNLNITSTIKSFPKLYFQAFLKRIFYSYFLRDFNRASLELVLAIIFILFGSVWGGIHWVYSIQLMKEASTGTVMLAVLPIILGFQMLLDAINFDTGNMPKVPLQKWSPSD